MKYPFNKDLLSSHTQIQSPVCCYGSANEAWLGGGHRLITEVRSGTVIKANVSLFNSIVEFIHHSKSLTLVKGPH